MYFDPLSEAFINNPYPILSALRTTDPIHWDARFHSWILTRHADVSDFINRRDLFRSSEDFDGNGSGRSDVGMPPTMLQQDPPEHTRLRLYVAPYFNARAIQRYSSMIRRIVDQLVANIPDGSFDVMTALAEPLGARVVANILGLPEDDSPPVLAWAEAFARMSNSQNRSREWESVHEEQARFISLYRSAITARRARGTADLISALLEADAEGHRLTEPEILRMIEFLLRSGIVTTAAFVGTLIGTVLRNEGEWQRLRADPPRIESVVEETLRLDPPIGFVRGRVRNEICINGQTIPAGVSIAASLASANRDSDYWGSDADSFNPDRAGGAHVSFGRGRHHCLGAGLARAEARILLECLSSRFAGLRLASETILYREILSFRVPAEVIVERTH